MSPTDTIAPPRVTVLVVAYHGDRWLGPCLDSLREASARRLHLLLVDNSGNTVIPALDLSPFDADVVTTSEPLGFAEANNLALMEARRLGQVILFLNQDTVSTPGWIDACLDAFDADPHRGALSPLIRTYEDDGWDPSFLACLPPSAPLDALAAAPAVIEVPVVPAPALLVRRAVLERVGPFDPIFGSYYEDYDLCRRITAAGYAVGFVTAARLCHFSGSAVTDPERERRRMRQILRNRVIHGLRGNAGSRPVRLARYALADLPRRLARGLARTPSSQPVGVTLGAYRDLLPLVPRLASPRRDRDAWDAYLESIGWPPATMNEVVSA